MILESVRKAYEECANKISGWRQMNKNDLINKYIDNEKDPVLSSAYISAIICRYWGNIYKYDKLSGGAIKDYNLYYDWFMNAILGALKARKWRDPTNKLYNDPDGPDKVMNRWIIDERKVGYQFLNAGKRKDSIHTESVDQIVEESGDEPCEELHIEDYLDSRHMIEDAFKKKDFFLLFLLDAIFNYDMFDRVKEDKWYSIFNIKRVSRHMGHIDEDVLFALSYNYNLPYDELSKGRDEIKNSNLSIRQRVEAKLQELKKVYGYDT